MGINLQTDRDAFTIEDIGSISGGTIVDPTTYEQRKELVEEMKKQLHYIEVNNRMFGSPEELAENDESYALYRAKLKSYEDSMPRPIRPGRQLDNAITLWKELRGRWAAHPRQFTQEVEDGHMDNGKVMYARLQSPSGVYCKGKELKLKDLEIKLQQLGYQLFYSTHDRRFLNWAEARPKGGYIAGTKPKDKRVTLSMGNINPLDKESFDQLWDPEKSAIKADEVKDEEGNPVDLENFDTSQTPENPEQFDDVFKDDDVKANGLSEIEDFKGEMPPIKDNLVDGAKQGL